jgi:hypothetical protein
MIETVTGTMLADLLRYGTGAPPSGPLTTALIGSGASLLMTRGKRPVGLLLLAAGGVLLWREAAAAQKRETLTPARPAPRASDRPAPPPSHARAGASAAAA